MARLIAAVEPDVLDGLLVALAQWGLTVLSAVWIVVLLAQQAEASAGRVARVIWALVIVLSLLLLIVAYVQQVSLLLRGLTFLSVGVILLFSTVGRRWLPFGQRGTGRSSRRYGGMRSTGMTTATPDAGTAAGNTPMVAWLRLYDRWRILPLMVVLAGLAVMVALASLTEARWEDYPIVTLDAVAVDPAELLRGAYVDLAVELPTQSGDTERQVVRFFAAEEDARTIEGALSRQEVKLEARLSPNNELRPPGRHHAGRTTIRHPLTVPQPMIQTVAAVDGRRATMQALVKTARGPGHLALQTLPDPVPGPGEVVISVAGCGICGTDLHIEADEYTSVPPVVLGHETAGHVAAVGAGVHQVGVGDRVTTQPFFSICGTCERCRAGRPNLCTERRSIGTHVNGAFAQYVKVPAHRVLPLPENLDTLAAAMTEPVACCAHGILDYAPTRTRRRGHRVRAGADGAGRGPDRPRRRRRGCPARHKRRPTPPRLGPAGRHPTRPRHHPRRRGQHHRRPD